MKRKLLIFGSIILISALAIGAELQSFYKAQFKGLNNSVNIRLLQDDEASDLSNFSLDEIGSIKERDLFGQYNVSSGVLGPNFITGLFKHYTQSNKYFIACAGTKVAVGSAGAFATDITSSVNTVTSGKYWSGVSFNNFFYMFNPSVPMMYYQGTGGLNSPGSTPGTNCSYSAIHKSRIWAARSDSLPYRLYWSSLNNGNDWATTGGYADLPDINQEITGIVSWGGYLYIFTETNIYVLLGSTPNDFSLRKTNSMVGAIAPRSIKVTDIGICFLSRSGVYAFDGNNSNKISDKINDTINNISKTLIQNACAIYDGKHYWLSYTPIGASYNNRIILYDILLKDWYIYQGDACNISYFERAYGGSDKGELYGGSSITNGIVYQLQSATGSESITHSSFADFTNDVTNNTVVDLKPKVELVGGNDSYTKLLSHFNAADGLTAYTTEDYGHRTVTFNNGAQIDTAQFKFGGSSCLYDGANDNTTIPDDNDWDLGTGDFTLDTWVRFNALPGAGLQAWLISHRSLGAPEAGEWALMVYNNGGAYQVRFEYNSGSYSANWTPAINTWYHIALERTGTTLKAFVDGSQIGSNGTLTDSLTKATATVLALGADLGASAGYVLNGWIDEPRVSKGIARYATNFSIPIEYTDLRSYGELTSQNLQINMSGTSLLDEINWLESLPTNSKITFQTRTGTTNDSVYFNGWQYWTSASSVTLSTVTNATTIFKPAGRITVQKPLVAQKRNELYYEDEDNISPNCAQFQVYGAISTNAYADGYLTYTDLSGYDWLTVWFKSPQTGNTVEFYMGNTEGSISNNYVTFNSVTNSTVSGWQKGYWYIGAIPSANRNGIRYIRMKYKGDAAGYLYLGDVEAHNYYTSGDIMSSTPNDYIQYRALFGQYNALTTPELNSVTLTYTPALSTTESSLSSYYYTKWFDFKTPQLNKQFDSLIMEVNSTTSSSVTLYCDYDIDFGIKTGTLSFPITTTANTVRILKNFPASTYGKSMRLKIYNNDKNATVTVKGTEIRYRAEPVTPD